MTCVFLHVALVGLFFFLSIITFGVYTAYVAGSLYPVPVDDYCVSSLSVAAESTVLIQTVLMRFRQNVLDQ